MKEMRAFLSAIATRRPSKARQGDENRSESGQASLVGLLVAVVIIGLLVWVVYFRGVNKRDAAIRDLTPSSTKQTIPGRAMDEGKAVDCRNNLSQLRLAIGMDSDPDSGGHPPGLQSIHGMPDSMKQCPVSGRPYLYDPRTGQVHCVTPGHQGF